MKKALIITVAALVAAAWCGCTKSGEYADLKAYLNKVITINEEYVSALEKANSAQDVADAMTGLGNKMEGMAKEGAAIRKKYSDMNRLRKDPPPEIKEELHKLEQLARRLLEVSMKTMQYMTDPAVKEASREMTRKMVGANIVK